MTCGTNSCQMVSLHCVLRMCRKGCCQSVGHTWNQLWQNLSFSFPMPLNHLIIYAMLFSLSATLLAISGYACDSFTEFFSNYHILYFEFYSFVFNLNILKLHKFHLLLFQYFLINFNRLILFEQIGTILHPVPVNLHSILLENLIILVIISTDSLIRLVRSCAQKYIYIYYHVRFKLGISS